MFKVFVSINCDDCGANFVHGRISSSKDPMEWNIEAYELIADAQQDGWDVFCDRIRCTTCSCPEGPSS